MSSPRSKPRTSIRWGLLAVLVVGVLVFAWWTNSREKKNLGPSNSNNSNSSDSSNRVTVGTNSDTTFDITPGSDANIAPQPKPKTTKDFPQTSDDCSKADGVWSWHDDLCWPDDESTCLAFDGLWGAYRSGDASGCYVRADDGGQVCQDNAECLGLCIVSPGQVKDEDRDDETANVKGTCVPRLPVQDCVTALTAGRPSVVCP
jgi:hypothetical protein